MGWTVVHFNFKSSISSSLMPRARRRTALDARLRIGELDAFGANAARATHDAPLRVDERDGMRRLRQVIRPVATRSDATGSSTTPAAGVPADPASLNTNQQPPGLTFVHRHDPKYRQPQNPRTIASRSHGLPLLVAHQERTPSTSGWPRGIALRHPDRRADGPPQQRSAQAAGHTR